MNLQNRHSFSSGKVGSLKFTKELGFIKALLNKNFSLYNATTLTQIQLNSDELPYLEKTITDKIPGCTEVLIKILDNQDYIPLSLRISISYTERNVNGKRLKRQYDCILGSVSSRRNGLSEDESVKLPLLCVLSGKSLTEIIHPILEQVLGCIINSITVKQCHMHWLMGILVNELIRQDVETDFSLVFNVKPGMAFSCNLPYGELFHLWTRYKNSRPDLLTAEDIQNFLDVVYTHFEMGFKINVSNFNVIELILKDTKISYENGLDICLNLPPLLFCVFSYIESELNIDLI